MHNQAKKPLLLVILDGWGHREDSRDNAIANANTPVWDRFWSEAPHTLISCSGLDVGLPAGQMGNSEVGHMSLGAGRVVYQNMTRIDEAIRDGSFNSNPAFTCAIDKAVACDGAVHIMGLLSAGGVHSHERQLEAAIELAHQRGAKRVYLHAFLDGRDTPPRLEHGTYRLGICRSIHLSYEGDAARPEPTYNSSGRLPSQEDGARQTADKDRRC